MGEPRFSLRPKLVLSADLDVRSEAPKFLRERPLELVLQCEPLGAGNITKKNTEGLAERIFCRGKTCAIRRQLALLASYVYELINLVLDILALEGKPH